MYSPRGAVLVTQGQVPHRLHLIRSGTVAVSSVESDGAEASFALRGPRALVGMEGLAMHPARAEVRALTPVRTCSATADEISRWLGPQDAPSRVLFELAMDGLNAREDDDALRRGEAVSRVARFLFHWSLLEPRPALPRQVMARALSMRPETLSRCLHRLDEQGLIRHTAALEVLDRAGLRQLGGTEAPVMAQA